MLHSDEESNAEKYTVVLKNISPSHELPLRVFIRRISVQSTVQLRYHRTYANRFHRELSSAHSTVRFFLCSRSPRFLDCSVPPFGAKRHSPQSSTSRRRCLRGRTIYISVACIFSRYVNRFFPLLPLQQRCSTPADLHN